jgi:drug/metabolite transporter superfamily protein YnfA
MTTRRSRCPWPLGPLGAAILALYGIVPAYQPAHFGRVHAATEVSSSVAARPA